jgi:hypothetical protein
LSPEDEGEEHDDESVLADEDDNNIQNDGDNDVDRRKSSGGSKVTVNPAPLAM